MLGSVLAVGALLLSVEPALAVIDVTSIEFHHVDFQDDGVPCGDVCQTRIVVRGWGIDSVTVIDPMGASWTLAETAGDNRTAGSRYFGGFWSQGAYPDQAQYNGSTASVSYEGGMPDGEYSFLIIGAELNGISQIETGVLESTLPEENARTDQFLLEFFGGDSFTYLGVQVRFNRFELEPLVGTVPVAPLVAAVVLPEPDVGLLQLLAVGAVVCLDFRRRSGAS